MPFEVQKSWAIKLGGGLFILLLLTWIFHWRLIESTDNAYVKGNITPLSSKIMATVEEVLVHEGQDVEKGQVLVKLDDRDYKAKLDRASSLRDEAQSLLAQAREKEKIQQLEVRQAQSKLEADQAEYERADKAYKRSQTLTQENVASKSSYDTAKATYAQAKSALESAQMGKEQSEGSLKITQLEVSRLESTLKGRDADLILAQSDFENTTIKAPIKCTVGQIYAKDKGQLMNPGSLLLTLVDLENLWVIANFKETQVSLMKPGQKSTIEVDGFSGATLEGAVESVSPASGAEFSLLPPDNATGNFTKIVQRVPVRVKINDLKGHRLVPGLSAFVQVKR